jgi:adenine-specific DNA-methyltransferase
MAGKKGDTPTPILDYTYQDKRKNIPTHELRDFVAEIEKTPKTMLYPRDPSLDPQLVWKGKDEQDREDLAVPCVPIYIQEKILPKAIIEEVRAQARKDKPEPQASLFADFNGIDFEDLIDFYRHEQNWSNRLILGDSLLVMTSLAEKEGLKGQVQMIYIDPPYGIKFGSNWQVSTRKREVKDGKLEDLTRQPEQVRAYRDTWKLGIHSYLTYLRDRLVVARELLTETGSIFVQIGDENVHLVRCLMDEVFGSENFLSQIAVRTTMGAGSQSGTIVLPAVTSYILWYGSRAETTKIRDLYEDKADMQSASLYARLILSDGTERGATPEELSDGDAIPEGARLFRPDPLTSQSPRNDGQFPVSFDGREYTLSRGYWKTNRDGMGRLLVARRLRPTAGDSLRYIRFLDDFPVVKRNNFWPDGLTGSFTEDKVYVVQSPTKIVARCLLMTTDPGDLVLDPTGGSGTTAYMAEKWGRRWITIDTSRVALALTRTRLMAARYPYYLLTDSPEGIKKEAETTGQMPPDYQTAGDLKKGFIYKRVPHITLKSIANNEEIDAIHTRWQEKLEPLRQELNRLLSQTWEDWELPREAGENWPSPAKDLLAQWWTLRRERQQEIDAAIARRADTELLFDQPYEDGKRLRVTGPFTVESLSPHRVLAPEVELPDSEVQAHREADLGQFETMILDNLRKAGVQNTVKNERLKFERLEPYAGEWLHAEGEYTEADGAGRRVAVCIGPEHGTVGPDLIKEAAKEAVRGVGFDLLIVCGFAFDPHVAEEAKRYGKLTVLTARMNPDLAMGDELLKKTGAGNLFMVFGEPDVEVRPQKDGNLVVEIKGLDIYDPTTGQIRSSSTDDLAAWFIDTSYNGESFLVRHAYFTGADQPYDKLKRALRADIDEAAWSALYSTTSRSFPKPATGKIAIKVINHYGDEVLKVFEI